MKFTRAKLGRGSTRINADYFFNARAKRSARVCVLVLIALTACATPTPTSVPTRASPTVTTAPSPTRVAPTATLATATTAAPTATSLPVPTRAAYKIGAALPKRNAPRTLLDAHDFARIKTWVEQSAWARDARDQIMRNADAYPANYLRQYNLKSPDLPPTGGQWSLWYICPDGLRLKYDPTHTPPHFCPSDGKYYASPTFTNRPTLYDEVIYQNRHLDLAEYARDLGLAYQLTGDKKYAENAATILRAYANAYPAYAQHDKDGGKARSGGKATAQTLDEAEWLIQVAWSFDLINDALTPADRTKIADNVLRQAAANIQGNRVKLSNWQTWHNAALAAAGFALEDDKLVSDAYADPENGFLVQIAQGAAADGFWWEGSWGYHYFTLQPMLYLAEMGDRVGLEPYAQPNLRAMLTAPIAMAMPDGMLPPFNDDSGTTLSARAWLYEIGYQRYRDPAMLAVLRGARSWQALLWGADNLPSASAPAQASIALPKAGYAILRAGDERYLALDFGPHGGGHGHYDKLGYITFGLGRTLALDPGTHSYAAASHNTWDKMTVAHNTIVVDEQNQAEATGNLQRFVGLPAFSLATADAGAAYKTAAITRTLALTPDYWLDLTRVTSLDRAAHRFDWIYHNPGSLTTPISLAPYTALPKKNGYEHLANPRAALTNDAWNATWDLSAVGERYGSVFNGREGITSSFTITRTQDTFAGQLDYDFALVADGYAVYLSNHLDVPNEMPTRIEARVFGDASNNRLTLRIMDATGEKFTKEVGAINWSGWQTIALIVDKSWGTAGAGNNDRVMDLPITQIALQINRTANGKRAGTILADNLALTFPSGRRVIEDFEGSLARVQVRMLGAPDTTIVFGTGIDERNAAVPFALARRQMTATTFTALFEPYRATPRITAFEPLGEGVRVVAPGAFADSIMFADGTSSERLFGVYSTDASVAYVRQNASNQMQTLVVANATKFVAEGIRVLLTSSAPVTAQLGFAGNALALTTETRGVTLRVLAPNATQVNVNGKPVEFKREGEVVIVEIR
ncbi:MAG: heparinase II/III family protein [Chloroflexi bacterium]|nr:heparinase II/III family protein [Chloroflexota bacterium]